MATATFPVFECVDFQDIWNDEVDGEWLLSYKAFKMTHGPLSEVFKDSKFVVQHGPAKYTFHAVDANDELIVNINQQAMTDFIYWYSAVYVH